MEATCNLKQRVGGGRAGGGCMEEGNRTAPDERLSLSCRCPANEAFAIINMRDTRCFNTQKTFTLLEKAHEISKK
eukprot:scaffold4052_cov123-Skeletonema_dohrnii-CCMP3373.AAC.4